MPCDYSRYPENWFTDIRPAVLLRSGNRCEWCAAPNYAVGYRDGSGKFHQRCVAKSYSDGRDKARQYEMEYAESPRHIVIVLTVAHYRDPDPMNCDLDNLKVLCQRCHNALDAPMRAKNAAETRRRKRDELSGQIDLFAGGA